MSAPLGFPKRGLESQRHRMSALGARGLSLADRKRAPGLRLYAPPPNTHLARVSAAVFGFHRHHFLS